MALWLFLLFCSAVKAAGGESAGRFSGLYSANTKMTGSAEDFAAAWLISKERFLASKQFIDSSSNMAGVSFAITRARCQGCYTMLSRDYFDFLVEHLSTTSNQIPYSHSQTFSVYYQRIQNVVLELKKVATDRTESDKRLKETIAVLIYSSITFSRPQANVQAGIREPYFEATFWSVYRYIPNIIVFVASDRDRIAVEEMYLPALEIKQLEVPLDHKNRTVALPRLSLGWVDTQLRMSTNEGELPIALQDLQGPPVGPAQRRVKQSKRMMNEQIVPWSDYKYVFFSEGDQILHWRQAGGFYDTVDAGQGKIVIVPHRMQVRFIFLLVLCSCGINKDLISTDVAVLLTSNLHIIHFLHLHRHCRYCKVYRRIRFTKKRMRKPII